MYNFYQGMFSQGSPHEINEIRSQEEPLPFDGVPHTMGLFENRLILGFESSIYSIAYGRK